MSSAAVVIGALRVKVTAVTINSNSAKLDQVTLLGTVSSRLHHFPGGSRVVRWCWVNFQCRWIIVGQGPTALAVGAGGGCLDIFTLIYPFSPLWETARYRLKYCLKGPLNPNNQPTNASFSLKTTVSY